MAAYSVMRAFDLHTCSLLSDGAPKYRQIHSIRKWLPLSDREADYHHRSEPLLKNPASTVCNAILAIPWQVAVWKLYQPILID
jgi:hypothetical protein